MFGSPPRFVVPRIPLAPRRPLVGWPHRHYLSQALAISLALSVGLGPLVQPAAAQSAPAATPTPTPAPLITIDPNSFGPGNVVVPPTPTPPSQTVTISLTPVAVTSSSITPTPAATATPSAPLMTAGCTGASRIFQGCPLGGPAEVHFEAQAVNQILQTHQLPASDASRVLAWARGDVRAAIYADLGTAYTKDPSQRTSDEQAAITTLNQLIHQKHVQAATVALNEYTKWNASPCSYVPPSSFTYDPGTACADPYTSVFKPPSPSLQTFTAMGQAAAYPHLNSDAATQGVLTSEIAGLAALAGYGAAVGVGLVGAAIGASLPALTFTGLVTSISMVASLAAVETGASASAAAAATAGSAGAIATAGPAAVIFATVVTAVVGGIVIADQVAIANGVQSGLSTANSYNFESDIRSGSEAAKVELLAELTDPLTSPDFPPTGGVPAPQSTDPQFIVGGASVSSISYTAGDKTQHSLRRSGGWFVDTDARGTASLTLHIAYLDQNGKAWTVSPDGNQLLMTDPSDPSSASYSKPQVVNGLPATGPAVAKLIGARLRQTGTAQIYLIDEDGSKRWIPDQATYLNLFRDWASVQDVPDVSSITTGPTVTSGAYLATTGAATGTKVYLIDNGQKRWVTTPAVMDKFDFNWSALRPVAQSTLDALPDGAPLT